MSLNQGGVNPSGVSITLNHRGKRQSGLALGNCVLLT